ncbi:hypothetical protein Pmani_028196 [Petrolisthes manimaculis]|uniref:Uncharacterized protein n=1 Tax=Petrolisthes manimaculis TaxID=1843537 RepID=A0AAE1P2N0_9EUCA|nr:hypothetical protein Pmani_028196 [Petrolisthes manimaculis]
MKVSYVCGVGACCCVAVLFSPQRILCALLPSTYTLCSSPLNVYSVLCSPRWLHTPLGDGRISSTEGGKQTDPLVTLKTIHSNYSFIVG